jgi:ADP-heptose:LPS heptosyltransferase
MRPIYRWQYLGRQRLAGYWWALRNLYQKKAQNHPAIPLSQPKKLLLIMTGLIGDSVMSTPAIIQARNLWPDAQITLLGQSHNCELLSACPMLDVLYETPIIPFALRNRGKVRLLKKWLLSHHFDMGIILLGNQFAFLLADIGIPIRVGTKGDLLEACLTHAYDAATPRTWGPSHRLNALRVLGYEVPDILPQLWILDSARKTAEEKLHLLNIKPDRPYAVIHPFGSQQHQWWPIERVDDLAAALENNYKMQSILIGNPKILTSTSRKMGISAIDATGAFSLQELLSVIEGAELVISTDSGPFHIGGALSRPLIGLFRSVRPEHAQHYPLAQIAFGEEKSCNKHCRWDYCRRIPCRQLSALTVSQILEQLRKLRNIGSSA